LNNGVGSTAALHLLFRTYEAAARSCNEEHRQLLTQVRISQPNQATLNEIIIEGTTIADVMAITGSAICSIVADIVSQIIPRRFAVRGASAMVIECGKS
jgi:hypothetical protein